MFKPLPEGIKLIAQITLATVGFMGLVYLLQQNVSKKEAERGRH